MAELSAASGRRCGPSARRPAREPRPPCCVVSARDRLGIGHRVARPVEPVLDDRRRDLGVELQPDAGPDGERLQARGGARQLGRARREVEDVLVPGEPAPADAVVAVDVDPADLGLAARGSRWRRGRPRAPGRRSRCRAPARPPSCASRRKATWARDPRVARGVHRAVGAQRDDGAGVARVGPRGDGRARAGRRARAPRAAAQSPTSPIGASGCCWTTSRRVSDYPFTRKAPRMNGWMRQKYVYVPSVRVGGVCHCLRLAAGVKPGGPEAELAGVEAAGAVGQREGDPGRRRARRPARRDGVEDVLRGVVVDEGQRLAGADHRRAARARRSRTGRPARRRSRRCRPSACAGRRGAWWRRAACPALRRGGRSRAGGRG